MKPSPGAIAGSPSSGDHQWLDYAPASFRRGGPDTTLSVWIVEQQEAQDKALSF